MKTYNVKEIASMLGINPETVRRWVRDGKLHAEAVSRQDGTRVSETELKHFLEKSPKYARVAVMGAALPKPLGIPFGAAAILSGAVLEHLAYNNDTEFRISPQDLEPLLVSEITRLKKEVSDKEEEIRKNTSELESLNESLKAYRELLKKTKTKNAKQ